MKERGEEKLEVKGFCGRWRRGKEKKKRKAEAMSCKDFRLCEWSVLRSLTCP